MRGYDAQDLERQILAIPMKRGGSSPPFAAAVRLRTLPLRASRPSGGRQLRLEPSALPEVGTPLEPLLLPQTKGAFRAGLLCMERVPSCGAIRHATRANWSDGAGIRNLP